MAIPGWLQNYWGSNGGASVGSGGHKPGTGGYGNQITGDPNYLALRDLIQAQSVSDKARMDALVQQALINYGGIPGSAPGINSGWVGNAWDPTTQAAANAANTSGLSTLARLQHWNQLQQRDIANGLAARGMLQSGDYGYMLGEEGLQYKQMQYDAMQQLLGNMAQWQTAYAQAEQQRQFQLAQMAMQVAQDRASNPVNYGNTGVTLSGAQQAIKSAYSAIPSQYIPSSVSAWG